METFADRLKTLLRKHRTTGVALAERLDINPRTFRSWTSGDRVPPRKQLLLLADTFGVTTDFLISGRQTSNADTSMLGVPMSDYVQVRYWPRGDDAPLEQRGEVAFLSSWLRERTYSPGECYLLRVPDDRMAQTIPAGAVVLFDHSQKAPEDDALFVLRRDDGPVIRRLRQIGGQWLVVCDNHAYPDYLTPPKKEDLVGIMGQVLWQSSIPI